MGAINKQRFERNSGFIHDTEQSVLTDATVAIAGAGGDGGMLAIQLARMGVGSFRLADPDPFEIENINRQAACTDRTLGMNKAVAVAGYINDINPDAEVTVLTDGITAENTAGFVEGTDLVIDETEFTLHALGIGLARCARAENVPMLTALNIGFGALATTFDPNGRTLERVLGFGDEQDIEEIAATEVGLDRWLPYLPGYVDLESFKVVASGEKSAPSIAPGVALAAGMGATQAFLNLVRDVDNHRPDPVFAPKAIVMDAMTQQAKIVRYGRASHYRHLLAIGANNLLGRVPRASY